MATGHKNGNVCVRSLRDWHSVVRRSAENHGFPTAVGFVRCFATQHSCEWVRTRLAPGNPTRQININKNFEDVADVSAVAFTPRRRIHRCWAQHGKRDVYNARTWATCAVVPISRCVVSGVSQEHLNDKLTLPLCCRGRVNVVYIYSLTVDEGTLVPA